MGELIGLKRGIGASTSRSASPGSHIAVRPASGLQSAPGHSVGFPSESIDGGLAGSFEVNAVAWAPDLAHLAYLLTGEPEAAEDLVADALFAAWKQWPTVIAAANPKAYVRRIVTNMAASRVRKLVRDRARLRLMGSTATEATRDADVSVGVDLRNALADLPRRQRECVVLRYGLDLSETDVADVLGISLGTVKSHTSKGAKRLRELLGPGVWP